MWRNTWWKYILVLIGLSLFVACSQPEPTSTPNSAPIPTATPVYVQQSTNEQIEAAFSEKSCETSEKPFEFNSEPYYTGPPPDTYLVRIYVETTSLWTNVDVEGIQSIKVSEYIHDIDPRINVQVEGLRVELSKLETYVDVLPTIAVELDVIVQKEGETAVFRIDKGNSGTTLYKLYSVIGNSTEEIARFIHDGVVEEGDNVRVFSLDLGLLSLPLALPSVEERYDGPLFDAHVHLVGSESEGITGVEDDRLFINPENADEFFAMMDKQGVIGLIGFLPINHENFSPNKRWTDPFMEQIGVVVGRHCERVFPFLFPSSLIGIPPSELRIELIDSYIKGDLIDFRGIGELHGGDYPGEDYPMYAGYQLNDQVMLELYDYAAENNLIVMIHPRVIDLEDLRDALQHSPKTRFLLHGGNGVEKFLPTLFQDYENFYYSLDAILLGDYTIPHGGMTKEEAMNNLRSSGMHYRLLAAALHYWKPLIEAYPNRLMWGTDALYSWHFEHDLYSELTWFARDLIGGLSPDVQERFAYKNAERLLELSN